MYSQRQMRQIYRVDRNCLKTCMCMHTHARTHTHAELFCSRRRVHCALLLFISKSDALLSHSGYDRKIECIFVSTVNSFLVNAMKIKENSCASSISLTGLRHCHEYQIKSGDIKYYGYFSFVLLKKSDKVIQV